MPDMNAVSHVKAIFAVNCHGFSAVLVKVSAGYSKKRAERQWM
jgi:hypothetical protein